MNSIGRRIFALASPLATAIGEALGKGAEIPPVEIARPAEGFRPVALVTGFRLSPSGKHFRNRAPYHGKPKSCLGGVL